MIYTVTFNPAIDYVVRLDAPLEVGAVNRAQGEDCVLGGKGINVSGVLAQLGCESVALGFVAGETGAWLERGLAAQGLKTDFVHLENGMTRINVKIKAGQETELNGAGPAIPESALQQLEAQLDKLAEGDILILAGSIPASLPQSVYERLLARLQGRGVRAVVDATRDLLVNVLPYHPFLIKPNNHELGEIVGKVLTTDAEIVAAARTLQEKGARNVLVSMAGDGALLVDENGEENLGRYDRRVNSEVVTDCFSGSVTGQRMVGETLYFLNTDGVGSGLCVWTRETGVQTLFGGDDYLIDFDTKDGKRFLFSAAVGLKLPEVYLWDGGQLEQLTDFNGAVLEGVTISTPERLTFTNTDGVDIDGFVMKPVGYEPGKRYPGILHIHGGPKMVFGPGFHHEMQLWAASGFFVCYCNPRGSCGKGNAFADLQGKYGEVDFQDLMEFTDEVLRRYPEIDADRMGVAGGSYGGFMTNWVIGHTDRFRCAVSQRSIANYVGDYLLSDIGYYYVPDQQLGTIWEHPERLWKASPLTYADRVKTPTLFIHADKDYRCTLANGLEMFAALKLHGVESKLCMFYGENHGLSREGKPSNRISRLSEILHWMEEHLKEE